MFKLSGISVLLCLISSVAGDASCTSTCAKRVVNDGPFKARWYCRNHFKDSDGFDKCMQDIAAIKAASEGARGDLANAWCTVFVCQKDEVTQLHNSTNAPPEESSETDLKSNATADHEEVEDDLEGKDDLDSAEDSDTDLDGGGTTTSDKNKDTCMVDCIKYLRQHQGISEWEFCENVQEGVTAVKSCVDTLFTVSKNANNTSLRGNLAGLWCRKTLCVKAS